MKIYSIQVYRQVNTCIPNQCGGQMSAGCLGVADVQTAWINDFLSNTFIPLFNGCCDTHDRGYCEAGASKLAIDNAFGQCMHDTCDAKYGDPRNVQVFKKKMKKWCHTRADIAHSAVVTNGLKPFNAVQNQINGGSCGPDYELFGDGKTCQKNLPWKGSGKTLAQCRQAVLDDATCDHNFFEYAGDANCRCASLASDSTDCAQSSNWFDDGNIKIYRIGAR
jgi:hypothetical protein